MTNFEKYQDRIILRCVMGSRAFGLDDERSDTDRRGIYLPRAEQHWHLDGVPEQLENDATQEVYWELQKFLVLALRANPNILECLYSSLIEHCTPLAAELFAERERFLSKRAYITYHHYVESQFRKIESTQLRFGQVKWKHAMHLIRLLFQGIELMKEKRVLVKMDEHRPLLLAIKHGEKSWPEVDAIREKLQQEFASAFRSTHLPDEPDFAFASEFLVKARRLACQEELP